jgi:hypothetical protein
VAAALPKALVVSSWLPPGPTIPPLPAVRQLHDVLDAVKLEYLNAQCVEMNERERFV